MTDAANPFDGHDKIPGISFTNRDETTGVMTPKPTGTRQGGKIKKAPEMVQQRDYDTKKPLFWKDQKKTVEETDSKAYTIVTILDTSEGDRALWAPKSKKEGSMCRAISDAIKVSGNATAVVGGELWVTLTGLVPNEKGGQPSKTYSAVYTAPNAFEVPTPPASVPAPPAPPTAVPAPPAPSVQPATTPEGFTLASLLAGGWTTEQAVAAYPVLGAVPQAAPSAPPAPPAPAATPPGNAAAALAQLSDEDLAMLRLNRDGTPVA